MSGPTQHHGAHRTGAAPAARTLRRRFLLGGLYFTGGALAALEQAGIPPMRLVECHLAGDWGSLPPDDKAHNERALRSGGRLCSAFDLAEGVRIWVITEGKGQWRLTTVMTPEEY